VSKRGKRKRSRRPQGRWNCSRTRAVRGEKPRPRVAGQIIAAGEPDARNRVFTAEALRRMAEQNPKELHYDEDQAVLILRSAAVKAPRPDDPPDVKGAEAG